MSDAIFPAYLIAHATALIETCRDKGVMLASVESCTGGLIAACLTEISGSSDVVERGFVTYSNEAKQELVGVPVELIATHGAVSAEVARAMAEGALSRSRAGLAVSVTGVAGPGGGSAEKPVGLVHLAVAAKDRETQHRECRFGEIGRGPIRLATVDAAFSLLEEML